MEGTECCERAILPEKALREKLNTVIEDEFSKVALRNTIKYFKPHSENDCVGATIKVLEYSLTKKEVPKPYQTLLKEIRKDSPVSSWLPSYSQQDTKLLVTFLNQECDVFSDFGNVSQLTHAFPYLTRLMSELLSFHSTKFLQPHLTEFVFRTALASSPMRRFFCFVCLFTPPNYFFNRSTKSRALMSTSSHFSPTKNFWS